MKISHTLRDLVIILFTSALILVGSEFALRLIFPDKIIKPTPPPTPKDYAFIPHRRYIVDLRPNIEKEYPRTVENGGQIIKWSNNDGFRGPPLRVKPTRRIVVYGDSNILARFSSWENTYTAQLEKGLSEVAGYDIEVINAGLVGAGPDQNFLRMKDQLPKLAPDLVILHIFADNDFGDLIRNGLYSRDHSGVLRLVERKFGIDKYFDRSPRTVPWHNRYLIIRALKRIANTPAQAALKRLKFLSKNEFEQFSSHPHQEFSNFWDHYDFDLAVEPNAPSSRLKRELMTAVLRDVRDLLQSNGVELFLVIQPSVIDLTTGNGVVGFDDLKQYPEYKPENLSNFVSQICIENGIYFLNLFDGFRSNNPEKLYFKGGNDHWNDAGQAFAAELTVRYVIQNPKFRDVIVSNK